jgi:hypothetical protein
MLGARRIAAEPVGELTPVILSEDFMILRLTSDHENTLSPWGERVARDGAFISRRGSGEGVRVRCVHGSEGSRQFLIVR